MNKLEKAYTEMLEYQEAKKLQKIMRSGDVDAHIRGDYLDTDNVRRFKLLVNELTGIYARKNRDYGNSFDESLDEDGLIVAKIRLGDKMKRFAQLIKNPAEVKDESKRDTLIDMANYAIMTVMWMDALEEAEAMKEMERAEKEVAGGADLDGDKIVLWGGYDHD